MHRFARLDLVLLLLLLGCGGAAAPTATPKPQATDFLTQAIYWSESGPLTMTCGGWNHSTADDQSSTASTMLTTLRGFDEGAASGTPTTR